MSRGMSNSPGIWGADMCLADEVPGVRIGVALAGWIQEEAYGVGMFPTCCVSEMVYTCVRIVSLFVVTVKPMLMCCTQS